MEVKYLNSEIERLNLLERNGQLSEWGQKSLKSFKKIRDKLTEEPELLPRKKKAEFSLNKVVQSLPKRLSNVAYLNAREMRYEDFISWWDEQV
jgi:hypothetical protein